MDGMTITIDKRVAQELTGTLLLKGFIKGEQAKALLNKINEAEDDLEFEVNEFLLTELVESPMVIPFRKKIGLAVLKAVGAQ